MKHIYTVVIIEDVELYSRLLQHSLSSLDYIQIVGTASTTEKGELLILERQPDLLFLDVELGDNNGFDLLHKLQTQKPGSMCTVIYSGFEKYAVRAFQESAFYFLQKTYDNNEFLLVMERFVAHKAKEKEQHHSSHESESFADSQCRIATISGSQIIHLSHIVSVEYQTDRKLWIAVLSDKSKVSLKRGTNAGTILAYSPSFFQISQSTIINSNYLSMINGNTCILKLPCGDIHGLTVSRKCLKSLHEQFNQI